MAPSQYLSKKQIQKLKEKNKNKKKPLRNLTKHNWRDEDMYNNISDQELQIKQARSLATFKSIAERKPQAKAEEKDSAGPSLSYQQASDHQSANHVTSRLPRFPTSKPVDKVIYLEDLVDSSASDNDVYDSDDEVGARSSDQIESVGREEDEGDNTTDQACQANHVYAFGNQGGSKDADKDDDGIKAEVEMHEDHVWEGKGSDDCEGSDEASG